MGEFRGGEQAERVLARRAIRGDLELAGDSRVEVGAVGEAAALGRLLLYPQIEGADARFEKNNLTRLVEGDALDLDLDGRPALAVAGNRAFDVFHASIGDAREQRQ